EEDTRGRLRVARPVFDAARGGVRVGDFVVPELFAGFRLDGDDAVVGCWHVEDAAHDDRRCFGCAATTSAASSSPASGRACSAAATAALRHLTLRRGITRGRCYRHVISPCASQTGDVRGRDFFQRRVPLAARVMTVSWPVRLRGGGECEDETNG